MASFDSAIAVLEQTRLDIKAALPADVIDTAASKAWHEHAGVITTQIPGVSRLLTDVSKITSQIARDLRTADLEIPSGEEIKRLEDARDRAALAVEVNYDRDNPNSGVNERDLVRERTNAAKALDEAITKRQRIANAFRDKVSTARKDLMRIISELDTLGAKTTTLTGQLTPFVAKPAENESEAKSTQVSKDETAATESSGSGGYSAPVATIGGSSAPLGGHFDDTGLDEIPFDDEYATSPSDGATDTTGDTAKKKAELEKLLNGLTDDADVAPGVSGTVPGKAVGATAPLDKVLVNEFFTAIANDDAMGTKFARAINNPKFTPIRKELVRAGLISATGDMTPSAAKPGLSPRTPALPDVSKTKPTDAASDSDFDKIMAELKARREGAAPAAGSETGDVIEEIDMGDSGADLPSDPVPTPETTDAKPATEETGATKPSVPVSAAATPAAPTTAPAMSSMPVGDVSGARAGAGHMPMMPMMPMMPGGAGGGVGARGEGVRIKAADPTTKKPQPITDTPTIRK